MKKVALIFIIWILVVNIFGILSLNRFNLASDTAYNWINPKDFYQDKSWNITDLHKHWDSFWYLDIAENGYSYKGADKLSNIAFFPLYPYLIRLVSFFTFSHYALAGWLLSILFLFLALIFLFKLIKEFHPRADPHLPLIFLLIFPTAFFLNAIYAESLFLFLSAAFFYYTLKTNFLLAGVLAFLAALTRITGILLFIPLLIELLQNKHFKQLFGLKYLALVFPPLGTLAFFFYHYLRFNDFFLWLKVQASWGRDFKLNADHFSFFSQPAIVNFTLDALFLISTVFVIYHVFKKLRPSYGLYMLATLLVALATGTLMSIGRYILVLFPMFILLAQIKNQYLRQAWVFSSILLLALNITLFVNNYWAG